MYRDWREPLFYFALKMFLVTKRLRKSIPLPFSCYCSHRLVKKLYLSITKTLTISLQPVEKSVCRYSKCDIFTVGLAELNFVMSTRNNFSHLQ